MIYWIIGIAVYLVGCVCSYLLFMWWHKKYLKFWNRHSRAFAINSSFFSWIMIAFLIAIFYYEIKEKNKFNNSINK